MTGSEATRHISDDIQVSKHEIRDALEQDLFFSALQKTHASDETLRIAGHVIIDSVLDDMGIARLQPQSGIMSFVRRLIRA